MYEAEDLNEINLTRRQTYVKDLSDSWWNKYYNEVFYNLLPYRRLKDTKRHRNLKVGDVCFLKYQGKIKADYRLCRVDSIVKDEFDIVRTVTVRLRSRSIREKPAQYKLHTKPQLLETGIQRLCLLIPVEEFQELPIEAEDNNA